MKDSAAKVMVEKAASDGRLRAGEIVAEYTTGTTGSGKLLKFCNQIAVALEWRSIQQFIYRKQHQAHCLKHSGLKYRGNRHYYVDG
jgi:hypothetical protein